MVIKYSIYINIFLLLLFTHPADAQKALDRTTSDSVMNPKTLPAGDDILQFVTKEKNIGTISEDDAPSTYRFTFHNRSQKSVTLTHVKTTCGCTAAEFTQSVVEPGEEGEVSLIYHPKNRAGKLYTRAFIYTNLSTVSPTAVITLLGEVTPTTDKWASYRYKMGDLRLQRKTVIFSEAGPKGIATERIMCANSSDKPLKVSLMEELLPAYVQVRTEPEVIPAGESADIVITMDSSKLPADRQEVVTFPIILKGINSAPSGRTITVKVKPGF